ncbi:hypothetical protein CXG81DRAFT_11930 [Caulochytrium protostelioides]|uniref:Ras-GEF domain-containing protein n=1 Tax=Caulochytrium protostelioides TaxID=1555241 RepID=A0A4P9X873_9FUNG|nr:hypothetical protein CXG81DRAFT_11930 [Caulochytrium protostelioides]|eukprot:RKP01474.1 hypothetical protein CXG81DRAFT_11930 [Caulochytrium protostelioides]
MALDPRGRTLLHLASRLGEVRTLRLILATQLIHVDATDTERNTALHYAVSSGSLAAVTCLLDAGACPIIANAHGNIAVEYTDDPEMVQRLNAAMAAFGEVAVKETEFVAQASGGAHDEDDGEYSPHAVIPDEIAHHPQVLKRYADELLQIHLRTMNRAKRLLSQCIEDKRQALAKVETLEQLVGQGGPRAAASRAVDEIHRYQNENQRLVVQCGKLESQLVLLETQLTDQDAVHRKTISELNQRHNDQVQALIRRHDEPALPSAPPSAAPSSAAATLAALSHPAHPAYHLSPTRTPYPLAPFDDAASLPPPTRKNASMNDLSEGSTTGHSIMRLEQQIQDLRNQLQAQRALQLREKRVNSSSDAGSAPSSAPGGRLGPGRTMALAEIIGTVFSSFTDTDELVFTLLLSYPSLELSASDVVAHLTHHMELVESGAAPGPFISGKPQNLSEVDNVTARFCQIVQLWMKEFPGDLTAESGAEAVGAIASLVDRKRRELDAQGVQSRYLEETVLALAQVQQAGTLSDAAVVPAPLAPRAGLLLHDPRRPHTLDPLRSHATASNRSSTNQSPAATTAAAHFDPADVARQLTLMEYELFALVQPREFLNLAWMKPDKEERAPNLLRMTKWSNHVVHWLVSEIVAVRDGHKARAAVFERIVHLAQHLCKLHNYNGAKEVMAALQTAAVYRLKKTKEAVANKTMRIYNEIDAHTSSDMNYRELRARVKQAEPPAIPFPGIYQGDLVFLDTCFKDSYGPDQWNFDKFRKIAGFVREIKTFQDVPYFHEANLDIQHYIREYTPLDVERAYQRSLECEPRANP